MKDKWPKVRDYQAQKVYDAENEDKNIQAHSFTSAKTIKLSRRLTLEKPYTQEEFDVIEKEALEFKLLTNIECRRFIKRICTATKTKVPKIVLGTNMKLSEEKKQIANSSKKSRLKFVTKCAFGHSTIIFLPRWAKSKQLICHELAHVITDQRHCFDGHGPNFCGVYLKLVRFFVSHRDCEKLLRAFKKRRVDYNEKIWVL